MKVSGYVKDLESPPPSVVAVMKNRWLSDGFKESALHTAIWSVLKAKRRLLITPDGFKAQFYNISEIVAPVLAWGFFGSWSYLALVGESLIFYSHRSRRVSQLPDAFLQRPDAGIRARPVQLPNNQVMEKLISLPSVRSFLSHHGC